MRFFLTEGKIIENFGILGEILQTQTQIQRDDLTTTGSKLLTCPITKFYMPFLFEDY